MYLEETQLRHEQYLLSRLQHGEDDQLAARKGFVQNGLKSIRSGLENIVKDKIRKKQLVILWWQMFTCHFLNEMWTIRGNFALHIESCWPSWKALNEDVGLGEFADRQYAVHSEKFIQLFNENANSLLNKSPEELRTNLLELQKKVVESITWSL